MEVPFFKPYIREEEIEYVNSALASGWLTSGECVKRFEQLFADYIKVPYCVAVNSATAALHLSVLMSGVRSGDYVLVPSMTFASTAEVLYYCNVHPLLVDCKLDDLSIDLQDAEIKLVRATEEGKRYRTLCREDGQHGSCGRFFRFIPFGDHRRCNTLLRIELFFTQKW
jgi:perosamine synthetase